MEKLLKVKPPCCQNADWYRFSESPRRELKDVLLQSTATCRLTVMLLPAEKVTAAVTLLPQLPQKELRVKEIPGREQTSGFWVVKAACLLFMGILLSRSVVI